MESILQIISLFIFPTIVITGGTVLILIYLQISLYYALLAPIIGILFFYVIIPIVFASSKPIQRHLVYLPKTRVPQEGFDYNDTEGAGLAGCKNFFLFHNELEYVGVWHLLPHSLISLPKQKFVGKEDAWTESLKHSGKHVIIYFHGNTGTRALEHRKELYWLLQNEDCHVIAFDYRGFADSSSIPISEDTTVADGLLVYKYVCDQMGPSSQSKVIIWGHSLGTGISTHTVAKIREGFHNLPMPEALILEAPFTNLGEAMRKNMRAIFYKFLPNFNNIFVSPLKRNGIAYETDLHIGKIIIPVLILHAIDDFTVPFELGEKLFQQEKQRRSHLGTKSIHFKRFPKGHGHKNIYTHPELPSVASSFIQAAISGDWTSFNCECCLDSPLIIM